MTRPAFLMGLLILLGGITPGTAQVRSNRSAARAPVPRATTYPAAFMAAAVVRGWGDAAWPVVIRTDSTRERQWEIRERSATTSGHTWRARGAGEWNIFCNYSATVVTRDGGMVLATTETEEHAPTGVSAGTLVLDSLFMEPGQPPAGRRVTRHRDPAGHEKRTVRVLPGDAVRDFSVVISALVSADFDALDRLSPCEPEGGL